MTPSPPFRIHFVCISSAQRLDVDVRPNAVPGITQCTCGTGWCGMSPSVERWVERVQPGEMISVDKNECLHLYGGMKRPNDTNIASRRPCKSQTTAAATSTTSAFVIYLVFVSNHRLLVSHSSQSIRVRTRLEHTHTTKFDRDFIDSIDYWTSFWVIDFFFRRHRRHLLSFCCCLPWFDFISYTKTANMP